MKVENRSIIKDAFELEGKTIPFTVHLAKSARAVNAKRAQLQALNPTDEEGIGQAIVELYTLIFGEAVVAELMDYYADDTMPVLTDLVLPGYDRLKVDALNKKMRFKNG